MSGKVWVCADHHFGHANICKFTKEDGSKLRPWDDFEEHDAELIRRHNEIVDDGDRVYMLGDCVINRRHLHKLGQLRGRKVLVKGNHDICKLGEYLPFFDDIRACVVGKMKDGDRRYILSHIPVHPDSLIRFGINIHGHLHAHRVKLPNGEPDERFICVSMEHNNFYPVQLNRFI